MEKFTKICNQESTIVYRESLDEFLGGIYFEKNTHQFYLVEDMIQALGERITRKNLTSFLLAFIFSIGTPAFAKSKDQFQTNSQTKDRGQLSSSDFEKSQPQQKHKSKYSTPQKNQSINDRLKNFSPKMDNIVDTVRLYMESKHPERDKALLILKLKEISPIDNPIAIMAQDHIYLENKPQAQTASRQEKEKWTKRATVVVQWIRKYQLFLIILVVGTVLFFFYQKFRNFKLFNLFNNPKDTTATLFPNGNGNVDVIQLIPEVEREVQILAEEQVLPEIQRERLPGIQSLSEQLEQLREIKQKSCSIRKIKLERYQEKYNSVDKTLNALADKFIKHGHNLYPDINVYNEKLKEITENFESLVTFEKNLKNNELKYKLKCE